MDGKERRPAIGPVLRKSMLCSIRAAGWGAAALALAGSAGAIHRIADLASHFRVLYLFVMFSALVTYVPKLRSRKVRTMILALVAIFNAYLIAALYLPPHQGRLPDGKGPSIRLIQFNTWPKNREDASVLSYLESEQPDICALQETTASLRASVIVRLVDRYEILARGSELVLIRRDSKAIRLRDWTYRQIDASTSAITARLMAQGRPVTILSLHATAPLSLERAALHDAQFEWIASWCREQEDQVIILGDLNATPWSHAFGRLLSRGNLIDSTQGFGVQPTWRTKYGPSRGWMAWPAQIPIDHCLHSSGFATVTRTTGRSCGSNHYPLRITLRSASPPVP